MNSFWVEPQNAGPEKLQKLMKFLHKGNYTEIVLLVDVIRMQLNFLVLVNV